jgi:hypothetical protein
MIACRTSLKNNDHVTSSLHMSSDNMKQIVYNNLKSVPCVHGGTMAIEKRKFRKTLLKKG